MKKTTKSKSIPSDSEGIPDSGSEEEEEEKTRGEKRPHRHGSPTAKDAGTAKKSKRPRRDSACLEQPQLSDIEVVWAPSDLTGTIPKEFWKRTDVTMINIRNAWFDHSLATGPAKEDSQTLGMKTVRSLTVCESNISDFSLEFWAQFPSLEEIIIHDTEIGCQAVDIMCKNLPHPEKVTTLELQQNDLQSLPFSIKRLTNLKHLTLCGNRLEQLPDSFSTLIHLKELYMSYNSFCSVPRCLSGCSKLKDLDLDGNMLANIPEFLRCFPSLRLLKVDKQRDTDGNEVMSHISPMIVLAPKLSEVHLDLTPNSRAWKAFMKQAFETGQFYGGITFHMHADRIPVGFPGEGGANEVVRYIRRGLFACSS
jgi:hypothetical protein